MQVNILGTEYKILFQDENENKYLVGNLGYCDKSTHKIVISKECYDTELGDSDWYWKKVLRHEIIHAFLFESGLHENFQNGEWDVSETLVDWIAIQIPKIAAVYEKLGIM